MVQPGHLLSLAYCRSVGLFAEFFARTVERYRQVHIFWRGISQQLLQIKLPGSLTQQVGTAHNIGNSLLGVVNHHRKLISVNLVCAIQHIIPNISFEALCHIAL